MNGLSTRNYVVVLGDLNARVHDGGVEGVVGEYGVPGENESGERLLDTCVEQELVITNSFFKKKWVNKEYQDMLKGAYGRVGEREAGELGKEWRLMKESFVGQVSDVCGKKFVGSCMRTGSRWWIEEVKMKVEEKKRAFEEWL